MTRVSVVICTYNRVDSLLNTLECLRYQNYADFEVVVVNGPSTDGTDAALVPWADRVRVECCPVANLSVSRNIGIRAAAGEIVAFIDDDALPEFDWLTQALEGFDNDPHREVGGVGGIVFDHTGLALQYKYSCANRFGEVSFRHDHPYDEQCSPGAAKFPYLQGTNALFRRDALLRVGGFDEVYDYHLDETDLCCRLIDAGYVLRQLPTAPVHHKFLPSGVRNHQRVVTNWFPLVKNHAYYTYRHASLSASAETMDEQIRRFVEIRVADARYHEAAGRLPVGSESRAREVCTDAMATGIALGRERGNTCLGPVLWPTPAFRPFPTVDAAGRRKIAIVSSGYTGNMTGGIARFISDLAPALARRGHEVRVITKATGPAAVDLEDGVWVHRVEFPERHGDGVAPHVFAHVDAFATAAVKELQRIATWSPQDLVYGPLWDVEILGVLRQTTLPVVVQVATPMAIAAEMAGFLGHADIERETRKLIELEDEILRTADVFHANSSAVLGTMADHYAVGDASTSTAFDRWRVVHLGLVDHACAPAVGPHAGHQRLRVLFVGRFERRKGIDTLLEAIEQIAPSYPNVLFQLAGEDRPLDPGQPLFGASWLDAHADAPWVAQVELLGSVDDEHLHQLYRDADIVALPSRYESFGLVMVEAMIHGRALISCDTSGIRDVVRDGIDGVLVPPGDVEALAGALRALLDDASSRERLGLAARERFVDNFTVDAFAQRFDAFLSGVRATRHHDVPLAPGEQDRQVVDPISIARLPVFVHEPSVIVIDDGTERVVPLAESSRVHRLDIDSTSGAVTVRCASGRVAVGGVIEVRT
jgi:glycogen synthase